MQLNLTDQTRSSDNDSMLHLRCYSLDYLPETIKFF